MLDTAGCFGYQASDDLRSLSTAVVGLTLPDWYSDAHTRPHHSKSERADYYSVLVGLSLLINSTKTGVRRLASYGEISHSLPTMRYLFRAESLIPYGQWLILCESDTLIKKGKSMPRDGDTGLYKDTTAKLKKKWKALIISCCDATFK